MAPGGTRSGSTVRCEIRTRLYLSCLVGLGGVAVAVGGYAWVNRLPAAVVSVGSGMAAIAFIWLMTRVLRLGVRFDDNGIGIRNLVRTYRISWPQVSHLADGRGDTGIEANDPPHWALKVVLRDGSAVRTGWMARTRAPAEMVERIKMCAARYGISAPLTGEPWL
jgi:hypothetical protein